MGSGTFRANGVTAYLKNNGTLEAAQQIANHKSPAAQSFYDRRADEVHSTRLRRFKSNECVSIRRARNQRHFIEHKLDGRGRRPPPAK